MGGTLLVVALDGNGSAQIAGKHYNGHHTDGGKLNAVVCGK